MGNGEHPLEWGVFGGGVTLSGMLTHVLRRANPVTLSLIGNHNSDSRFLAPTAQVTHLNRSIYIRISESGIQESTCLSDAVGSQCAAEVKKAVPEKCLSGA